MNDPSASTSAEADFGAVAVLPLGEMRVGQAGVIVEVTAQAPGGDQNLSAEELHQRLLEFGFVEGAHVAVLHEGAIRRDPIAVKLDDMRVGVRRRDARGVTVLLDKPRP